MPSAASKALYSALGAAIEFIQTNGWTLLGLGILLYILKGYAEEALAKRRVRKALEEANDPARVAVLETERRRVREEQQRAHLAAVEAAERERRERAAAAAREGHISTSDSGGSRSGGTGGGGGSAGGGGGGGYNPLAPQPMTYSRIASTMRNQRRGG
jgi:uncharacterized membrane protein YgcG